MIHGQHWQQIFTDQGDPDQDEDTDNTVRQYFNNNLHCTHINDYTDLTRLQTGDNPLSSPITNYEIMTITDSRKTYPGHGGIDKTIIKLLHPALIQRLTHIFNSSLAVGYSLDKFNEAAIKLIPKQDKTSHLPSNFRPTFLLEVLGKIFKRIINKKKYSFKNIILNDIS